MTSQTDTAAQSDTAVNPSRGLGFLALTISPLFFSTNLIIGRAATGAVEPATLAFWRWAIAFAILLPFALRGLRANWPALKQSAAEIFAMAFLAIVICGALIYLSLRYTTATNATLIYTTSPVLIVLLEWAFRGIRPKLRQMAGIALAFAGVAVIIFKGDMARLATFEFNGGDIGVALSALAWALYSVILRRKHFRALPTITLFCAIAGAGIILMFPLMLWETVTLGAFPRSPTAWFSILGVALLASVLAFSTFQYGVKTLGPSIAGVFMYLLPVFGIAQAIVFLGETLKGFHLAGIAGVAAGVLLATLPQKRPAAPPPTPPSAR
ncbi:DMT family transporter [Tepidamorphus sp. 3E244]|uniref:DMT family transporter n=1 Tax=Tepidamorphus sp. 3E244 TaxID=3385498 RepID=UPI0038FD1560